jgi:hypothetical protein
MRTTGSCVRLGWSRSQRARWAAPAIGCNDATIARFSVETTGLRIPVGMHRPLREYEQYARERRHLCRSSLAERMHSIAVFLDFLEVPRPGLAGPVAGRRHQHLHPVQIGLEAPPAPEWLSPP